jgi:transcriptional regulator with XRE-family HTH domain
MRGGAPLPLRPRGGFGGYLHELRRERGQTIRQVAAAAGVHHTYVSKLERGDRQAPEEAVVEALAAAVGATPAQLDQLRWRAGLAPRGAGAPGQDDPTLTLVAEALGDPSLTDRERDFLRQGIAQVARRATGPDNGAPLPPGLGSVNGVGASGTPPGPAAPSGTRGYQAGIGSWASPGVGVGAYPGAAAWYAAPGAGPAFGPVGVPGGAPGVGAAVGPAAAVGALPHTWPAGAYPSAPAMVPEAPPDGRATLLAGLLGGWQTLEEAAAELRVMPAYLWDLVQTGQLKAWVLPGAPPGLPAGIRLRREDVLALLQPVQVLQPYHPPAPGR